MQTHPHQIMTKALPHDLAKPKNIMKKPSSWKKIPQEAISTIQKYSPLHFLKMNQMMRFNPRTFCQAMAMKQVTARSLGSGISERIHISGNLQK